MDKENNLTDFLTDVANAIRVKKGTEELINPQDFSSEIKSIKSDPVLVSLSKTYDSNITETIKPSDGVDGFNSVTIEVAVGDAPSLNIQSKEVTLKKNKSTETISPDEGYYMKEVVVTTDIPMKEKTVDIFSNGTTEVYPDAEGEGIGKVTINVDVPNQGSDVSIEQVRTVDITENNHTRDISPAVGYDALAGVNVNVNIPLQDKTVEIRETGETSISADAPYEGLNSVKVTPILENKTTIITANNTYLISASKGNCGIGNHEIIVSVPTSGGGGTTPPVVESKDVNFYDYDGTLLHSYTKAEAQDLTALPDPPSTPEGLDLLPDSGTWNYTLDEIQELGGMCDVGAMYVSPNPYVTLVIEPPYDGFTARFMIKSSLGNADVNWGDGISSQVGGQDSYFEHTYEKAGRYTISYRCQNANATVTLGTQTNTTICGDKTSTSTYDYVRTSCLVGVIIGEKCSIQVAGHSFAYSGLRFCILSSKVQSIPQYTFQYCSQLKHITLPKSCSLGGNAFAYSGLKTISLGPEGGAGVAMGSNLFPSAMGLRRIVIPRHTSSELTLANFANTHGLTTMVIRRGWNFTGALTFRSLNLLDLSDYTTVPTLGNTLTLPASCKILVQSGLLSRFQSATNWSSLSSQFIGV